uniref:Peptidase S1 n=1 Tax=Syphacia muris TaxID=451379 RepID=A0A0N5AJ59_9BILA
MIKMILLLAIFAKNVVGQSAADEEFSPYIYTYSKLPFKNNNYARNWYGWDLAYIQSSLLAPAKPSKKYVPQKLPYIQPLTIRWSNLKDVSVNQENTWNFDKRIDSKVWWP